MEGTHVFCFVGRGGGSKVADIPDIKAISNGVDIECFLALIKQFTENVREFSQYQADSKTKSAVERQLSIVGEAVNNYRKLEESGRNVGAEHSSPFP